MVYFLRNANDHSLEFEIITEMIGMTKKLIIENIQDLNDIEIFCSFKEAFPGNLSEGEIEEVLEVFEEVAYEDVFSTDDPEDYRQVAAEIENISDNLGVDMSSRLEELEKNAKELEEEMGFQDEEYEGGYSGSGGETCSDADIVSIFNTLN